MRELRKGLRPCENERMQRMRHLSLPRMQNGGARDLPALLRTSGQALLKNMRGRTTGAAGLTACRSRFRSARLQPRACSNSSLNAAEQFALVAHYHRGPGKPSASSCAALRCRRQSVRSAFTNSAYAAAVRCAERLARIFQIFFHGGIQPPRLVRVLPQGAFDEQHIRSDLPAAIGGNIFRKPLQPVAQGKRLFRISRVDRPSRGGNR